MGKILVVDDSKAFRRSLALLLEQHGHTSVEAADGEQALQLLEQEKFDVVVSDLKMEPVDGVELLKASRSLSPFSEFILVTAYGTIETAVEAMKSGAYDYLTKPFDEAELLVLVDKALEKADLNTEVKRLGLLVDEQYGFENIVAESRIMRGVIHQTRAAAQTDNTVLILGESGTGKDLLARAIHTNSQRCKSPLMVVNCASLAPGLEDSELFGYVKGAFTGAHRDTMGLVAAAHYGTLFLDEVGDLSLSAQAKLLRCIETGEVRRIGDTHVQKVDIRLVAATNHDLHQAMQDGTFREDLFYRLSTVSISIPPLRERREDIPPLAFHLLTRYITESGRDTIEIDPPVMDFLNRYPWPGNVRQLDSCLRQASLLATCGRIGPDDLPDEFRSCEEATPYQGDLSLAELEKRHILNVLQRCQNNRQEAQRILGISRATLQRRLKDYGVSSS